MHKLLYLFSPVLFIFFISCDKDNTGQATFSEYPLAIGNSWTYKTEYTLTEDSLPTTNYQDHIWSVEKDTTINGEHAIVIAKRDSLYSLQRTDQSKGYYTNRQDGFYRLALRGYSSGNISLKKPQESLTNYSVLDLKINNISYTDSLIILDNPFKYLQFPIILNDSWTSVQSFLPAHSTTSQYIQFETITVPAGTFDCVKVALTSPSDSAKTEFQYFSEYGLVKQVLQRKIRFASDILSGDTTLRDYFVTTELISKNF